MAAPAPAGALHAGREARLSLLIATAWLLPWAVLTAAAQLAGGHPQSSPVDFVNPARVAERMRTGAAQHPWRLVDALGTVNAALFWLVLVALAGSVAASLRVCPLLLRRATGVARLARGSTPPQRHARWARTQDLRGLRVRGPRAGAFIIGRHGGFRIATQRETSVLVIGPTRSGKTSALVVPNLLEWHGPAVVTSTKTELVELTAGHRQRLGPVFIYDPTGDSAARFASVPWSPVGGCEDLDHAWLVASWLCAPLQQGSGRGDNDWAHWAESGKLLIAPLLFVAARTAGSMADVHAWVHGFDLATPMALLEDLAFTGPRGAGDDPDRAIRMLMSVDQRPERERGTVFSTVMRIFNVFNERAVMASATASRFDPGAFVRSEGTLYLCTPRQSPERIASLFVGILMSVVTAAYALNDEGGYLAPERMLGLFLDELPNVVPVEDLPSLASQGAGRGVLLMSIVQDLSQLRARYGTDRANSILNNHGCKVVLPGVGDPETGDIVSRLVGRGEFTDIQVSRTDDGRSTRSYSLQRDSMATPDALRRLDSGSAVVLHRGSAPAIVRLMPWYRSRRYQQLTQLRYFKNADQRSAA